MMREYFYLLILTEVSKVSRGRTFFALVALVHPSATDIPLSGRKKSSHNHISLSELANQKPHQYNQQRASFSKIGIIDTRETILFSSIYDWHLGWNHGQCQRHLNEEEEEPHSASFRCRHRWWWHRYRCFYVFPRERDREMRLLLKAYIFCQATVRFSKLNFRVSCAHYAGLRIFD